MTRLFKISTTEHIDDLTGSGAKFYGGRWNSPGYPVIYTSGTRSLAALEFLVHVPMALAPEDLSIIEINIPGKIQRKSLGKKQLPPNWRDYPAPDKLASIGTDWLKSKSSLLLEIPSAVLAQEVNILINPLHNDMQYVRIAKIEEFSFDPRLLVAK